MAQRRAPIVNKLVEAARNARNHRYSQSRGIPELRREIATRYQTNYGVELDPEREAIVTIGAKDALAHLLFATVGPGDAVVSPNPAYPDSPVRRPDGGRPRLHAADAGRRHVPEPAGGPVPHVVAQAEDDPDLVPAQPDHHVRGPGFLRGDRAPGARARHA